MSDGALPMRQRIRAPLRFAVPPSRTSQHAVPLRSDAIASRRLAVKSRALGSPHNSPMTQERAEHLTPSSIAHRASRASRASIWMSCLEGNPDGWTRPDSRIAMRSWTHRIGLAVSIWARRKPAHAPSRGWTENSSLSVGDGGIGKLQYSGESRNPEDVGDWAPALAGAVAPDAETAPPATRDRSLATRLTTLLFSLCSYSRDSRA